MYLLYHHIADFPMRQKPVKISNKKYLKIKAFSGRK